MLYERVKRDLIISMKIKIKPRMSLMRILLSDVQRDPNKDYSDEKVKIVIQQTINKLKENYDITKNLQDMVDVAILQTFLPVKISVEELVNFLDSLDFSEYKNKNQVIGLVKKRFDQYTIDVNAVKELLEKY